MGSSTKILIGALLTALLAWFTYATMCTVGAAGGIDGNAAGAGAVAANTEAGADGSGDAALSGDAAGAGSGADAAPG